jgi:hypothetical protein
LQDVGPIAQHASHVDDLAAALAQMPRGHQAAVQNAEVVGIEESTMVLERDLLDGSEDCNAGIVDPGIEAAELADRRLGDSLHVVIAADIRRNGYGSPTLGLAVTRDFLQGSLVPGHESKLGTTTGQGVGRRQADAAGRSGENHNLLLDGLEAYCHGTSWCENWAKATRRTCPIPSSRRRKRGGSA